MDNTKKGDYKGFVSKEAYLRAEKYMEEKREQIIGYKDKEGNFYKHNKNYYQTMGLSLAFAAWIISHIDAPIGLIIFGIGLFIYFGGPKYSKRVYLYEEINWQGSYMQYHHDTCPNCGSEARIEHLLVTECPSCHLQLCAFGAMVRTARKEE